MERRFATRRITINVPRYAIKDLAAHMQMSVAWVKGEIHKGKLEAVKIGNRWRVSNVAVHRYLQGHPARLHVERHNENRRRPLTVKEALLKK